MKHTKGKWEIRKCQDDDEILIGVVFDGHFCTIAAIPWYGEDDSGSEEAEANASLIAATLALLDVSKLLSELFPENDMSEMDAADFKDRACQIMGIVLKAKEAITKAERNE